MVESGECREKVESVPLLKNFPDEFRKRVDECEYRKMVESGRVPGKGRIHATLEKLSGRVSRKGRIIVNTGKW